MKFDLQILLFSAIAGAGVAYFFLNNNTIFQYPITAENINEKGKEDYKPYSYQEPSRYIPPEMMNVPLDPNEPPNIRDPREIQADILSSQKEQQGGQRMKQWHSSK